MCRKDIAINLKKITDDVYEDGTGIIDKEIWKKVNKKMTKYKNKEVIIDVQIENSLSKEK